jgi:hypothetical protein
MVTASGVATAADSLASRRRVESTARELASTLGELSEDALDAADRADDNDNDLRAERLFDVAQAAKSLSNKVTGQIVKPLQRGGTLANAKAQLARLKPAFARLDEAALELNSVPGAVAAGLIKVKKLKKKLKDLLDDDPRDGRIVL